MKTLKIICIASLLSIFVGCVNNSSSSERQSESPKYDRSPFAVYVYDGNKEIVLYENPRTATVGGISGSWYDTNMMRLPGEEWPTRIPVHYVIWYGEQEKVCVISPGRELVFFGNDQSEAWRNLDNESKWKDCEKKRL